MRVRLELVKGADGPAPIVVAVTVERSDSAGRFEWQLEIRTGRPTSGLIAIGSER
jgi:hypothetical protein